MISYSAHLRHYKKSFDSALKAMKDLKTPTVEDRNKINKLQKSLSFKNLIISGKVYTFDYNALGKRILPYYDRYPLVLVILVNRKKHTFMGLNLHYLTVEQRNTLIKLIMKTNYNSVTDRIITKYISVILRGLPKMMYNKCLKQYRMDRIIGISREISPLLLEEINNVNDNTFINKNQSFVQSIPLVKYYR